MKDNLQTMTIKIEVFPFEDDKEKRYSIYRKLREWQNTSFQLANEIVNYRYMISNIPGLLNISEEKYLSEIEKYNKKISKTDDKEEKKKIRKELWDYEKEKNKEKREDIKNILCQSEQNIGYCLSKKYDLPSYIGAALNKKIHEGLDKELFQVKIGNQTLRTYKKNISVPFMKSAITNIYEENGKYFIKAFKKDLNVIFCIKNIHKDKKNIKLIQYLIENKSRLCDSEYKIINKNKKDKIFFCLVFKYPIKENYLNPDIVVGVDLGFKIFACCGLNNGLDRLSIGTGMDFIHYDKNVLSKERRLQKRRGKSYLINKGGKGRNKKLKAYYSVGNKMKDYRNTYNHVVSNKVIQFALKNKAGIIHMELLSKIDKNKLLKKYWSYYDLQQKIEYKAKKNGIAVKYIDPYHTSQTCSVCGNYEEGQRPTQKDFICKKCGKKLNADYNASVNIAKSIKYITKKEESEYYNNHSNMVGASASPEVEDEISTRQKITT